MNAIYNITITPNRDLDVSHIIQAESCVSLSECKNKMRELILSKHHTYWKRIHRISAQYKQQTLILDPKEIIDLKYLQNTSI